ncbi:MAG: DUF3320 domain-containing protein, partial [Methanomassiliicoccaceae archaeon]|nr:DUF3320 domain-containing protein [Methanomassiliicoccaceae archaeon]
HFRTALDSASSSYVEDFSLRADGIEKMCAELSAPVRAIQRRTNTGKNLHELVLLYDSVRSEKIKHIEIPDALVDRITPDSAERWERMVESMITAARALGHPSKSSLSDTGITKHDNTTGLKITEQLKEWIAAAEDAERISELLISSVVPAHNTHATASLASLLLSLESLPDGMLNADDLTVTNLHVHDLLKILRRSFEIINNISRSLSPDTAEESIDLLRRQHSLITSALDRLEGIRLPINMDVLNGYLEEILSVEEKMMPLLKLLRDIRTEWYDSVLSADTDDIMRKWMEVSGKRLFSGNAKRMFMYEIREHLRNQSVTFDGVPNALRYVEDHGTHTKYVKWALEAVDVLNGGSYSILGDDCRSLEKLYLDTLKIIESLRAYGDPTALFKKYSETPEIRRYATELVSAALRYDDDKKATEELLLVDITKISSPDDIRGWKELSKKWLANIKGFGKIAEWNRYRRALEDEGLRCVIDAYMEGMDHDLMSMSFRVSMLRYLMDSYISKEPSLASFDAKAFMQRSSTFRDAMDGFIAVCRAEANATLESRVPDISSQPQDAEALQRTILTSGRGATIRSLMKDAKSVIPAVCPCMIMGPSSVSHYLDHEQMFDIVIIEDASSMPTHRAIDIITRGKDVIISGDRQHMPASLTVNNNIADTESIMDACSSVSLPKYDIYSMDDENLAEFRNSSFYDMKMGTFPYARKEEPKIRTVRVNGCYNRASKSNDIEAEAIVRDVLKRLKACNNKISLGIITFSDGQKEMIEDMLTKELARDAAREGLMHTGSETLFVRTINDMRGHERDTIIISPGIGKDPAGRLTADLSPFDRPNGERRLNAAMAYARNEIVIFSSLESTDIPDGKGAGTDALRKLLVYTEKGLPPRTAKKDRMRDLIAEALTEKGFTVHCDIGNSGMTVDIAIADPQHPDRYIMGVLVDSGPLIGPNAMDNEYTYIRGLNREGWEIRRVLTLDWLKDPARTINDIADAVDKRTQDPERWSPKRKETPTFDVKTIARTSQTKVKPEIVSSKRPYVKANIAEKTVSLEALFSTSSRKMIERDMMKVIDAESPVAASVVAQRLCDAYGMKRSVKLMEHLMMMINRMDLNNTMTPWNTKVLWKTGQNPASYESFRVPVEGEKRPVRDIAPKELTNAIFEIVLERRIVSGNDMIIAAAKLFGNDSVTDDDKNIITRCVNIAID